MTVLSSKEGVGGHLQGIQRLWAPPGDGDRLPIPLEVDIGVGQRLDGSGQEFVKGEVAVEEDDEYPKEGGGGAVGVRIFL